MKTYFSNLNQIANLFSTKLLITNRNYYRMNATSLNSIKQVINYLDSLDWIEAAKLIIDNKHYTLEGKNQIDPVVDHRPIGLRATGLLKNRMNRNRTIMDFLETLTTNIDFIFKVLYSSVLRN